MTMDNEHKESTALHSFENQAYMNLETYRKNGEGVKTPVWMVTRSMYERAKNPGR